MSLGPVMVGIAAYELSQEEREMLQHPMVGAVILFSRNYHDISQLQHLIAEIHQLREPRLLVAVDHEGGRVQRFRSGFTELPPVNLLGEIYNQTPKRAKRLAEQVGWLMAAELRAVDVDFSFAPVLDINFACSEIIGNRSFHRDPQAVADLAHSYMTGMKNAGMAATGKHFPGHGAVEIDTHKAMAIDPRPFADIDAEDLIPFQRLVDCGLAGIMPGHVIYPEVDEQPAGFSPFWLQEILRKRLGFQGVIFSDDLLMEGAAVAGSVADRAEAALTAGCDMVLICDDFNAICSVLDHLERFDNPVSHIRLARMHGHHQYSLRDIRSDARWRMGIDAINALVAWDEETKTKELL